MNLSIKATLILVAIPVLSLLSCTQSQNRNNSITSYSQSDGTANINTKDVLRPNILPATATNKKPLEPSPTAEILYYDYEYCQVSLDENYYTSGYDPLQAYQWYLDMANVKQAWQIDPTQGEGIEIAVIDGGVQLDHEDLAENILKGASVNVLVNTSNYYHNYPYPYDCRKDIHGTAVAGIIAAVGDNGRGIKGIAPKAKLWSSNLVAKNKITSEGLERTFRNRLEQTAVSSNSWTSASKKLLVKADPQFYDLIDSGLVDGYYAKGTSYVFAAGNSDDTGDMATYWEVLNHRGLIVVCAVAANSQLASFSETGANLWVCAPSSSGGLLKDTSNNTYTDVDRTYLQGLGLPTTDISGVGGYNNLTQDDYWQYTDSQFGDDCYFGELPITRYNPYKIQFASPGTQNTHGEECAQQGGASITTINFAWPSGSTNSYNRFFGGTSASAPIVSGVIGLIRSAYPELTWRDIKLILAESSNIPEHAIHESQTGALSYSDSSRYYSHHIQYGFGMIDAAEALLLAADWDKPLAPEKIYVAPPQNEKGGKNGNGDENGNKSSREEYENTAYINVPDNASISFIEWINIELAPNDYHYVNRLSIKLISPNKVESTLVRPSKCPTAKVGDGEKYPKCQELTQGFTFASSAHLGENPSGTWHLEVKAGDIPIKDFKWKLIFYGH